MKKPKLKLYVSNFSDALYMMFPSGKIYFYSDVQGWTKSVAFRYLDKNEFDYLGSI